MDLDNPFYRPLWRRVAICVATGGWAALELLYFRDGFWAALFVGIFGFSLWTFILNWKRAGK